MKYGEGAIPKTVGQLVDEISDTMLRAPWRQFPDGYDLEGVFYSMARGVENLRKRLGVAKAEQVLDMLRQAKAHYEAGDPRLGGALMEDTEMAIKDRQPWAYPKDLYRWPILPRLPEVSEADYLDKGDEDD
jgi:hypothetical protein